MYCRVVNESHPNRYQLQTKYGILATHYPIKELLRIPENACDTARNQLHDAPTKQVCSDQFALVLAMAVLCIA
jgi:hypothetical protein